MRPVDDAAHGKDVEAILPLLRQLARARRLPEMVEAVGRCARPRLVIRAFAVHRSKGLRDTVVGVKVDVLCAISTK